MNGSEKLISYYMEELIHSMKEKAIHSDTDVLDPVVYELLCKAATMAEEDIEGYEDMDERKQYMLVLVCAYVMGLREGHDIGIEEMENAQFREKNVS